ncbi:hypothetical protein [Rhodococcus sp. MALMAid1271]
MSAGRGVPAGGGLGACRPANYIGVLDALEHFDGTSTHLLYM